MDLNRKPSKTMLLWFFPVLLLVVSMLFLSQILPVYIGVGGYDMDPVYQYLFNGLLLLHGNTPEHFDHPGTPLQLWTGILIVIRWAIMRPLGLADSNLYADVMSHPEPYIAIISISLAVLNGWANYFLGKRIYSATNQLGLAVFVQAFVLEYSAFAPRPTHLGAESFLILAGMLLVGLLAPFIFNSTQLKDAFTPRQSRLVGLVAGFGLAVKMNFLPMVGLLFLLDKKRDTGRALIWFVGSYLFLLLPVMRRMGGMLDWVIDIATHSGRHGSGTAQLIDVAEIGTRAMQLIYSFPSLAISTALLLVLIVYRFTQLYHSKQSLLSIKAPFILAGVIILESLLVIKHPGAHYMIPVLPLGYLGIAYFFHNAYSRGFAHNIQGWISSILVLIALVTAAHSSNKAFNELHASKLEQIQSHEQISTFLAGYPEKLVLGTFRCNLQQCAIAFGGQYATKLGKYLDTPLIGFGLFNIWDRQIKLYQNGEKRVSMTDIASQLPKNTPVFLVTPILYPGLDTLHLKLLLKAPSQYLFQVENIEKK